MNEIPKASDPECYTDADFQDEIFAEIVSDDRFDVEMQYPLRNMRYAEEKCFVRKEVSEMLKTAQSKLPDGYKIKIWDAWRPFQLQHELYETYSKDIIKKFQLENKPKEQRERIIATFVSVPVENREVPPVHTTGGAVDVTIVDSDGRELEMGTMFDEFSEKTNTAYFEETEECEIKRNRRMLYQVMTEAGFTNLPSEWWHFDYGDRFWGYYSRKPAIYEGVFSLEEIHEKGGGNCSG